MRDATGPDPIASLTVTKLRWLRDAEPENAARVAAVALPHDWLTWRIAGYGPAGDESAPLGPDLGALVTDASDASGTGYYDATRGDGPDGRGAYRLDLLEFAFGRTDVVLPRVVGPSATAGVAHPSVAGSAVEGGTLLGPGAGDNAGAALGLGMVAGDVAVSIGTSGVVSAVTDDRTSDGSGLVNGFSDASGRLGMRSPSRYGTSTSPSAPGGAWSASRDSPAWSTPRTARAASSTRLALSVTASSR